MTSPDIHTLTGAYALDALDALERRQFEAHLADCPECAREVEELRVTSARLGLAVSEQPPADLQRRIMAEVAATRQDPPVRRSAAGRAQAGLGHRGTGWRPRPTTVAAAVLAVGAVLLAVTAVRTGEERDLARTQLAQAQARYAPVAELMAAADARGSGGAGARGGTAFVLISQQLNRAALFLSATPAAPPGHTYQAWLIGAGSPRSVGLVTAPAGPGSGPALVFSGLGAASKFGLTVEPSGGSAQPTTRPVILLDLPT